MVCPSPVQATRTLSSGAMTEWSPSERGSSAKETGSARGRAERWAYAVATPLTTKRRCACWDRGDQPGEGSGHIPRA
eukprot:3065967-Pyramimonas_sp.AAC.1